jgi:O-phosphoseryl-tRNA(Cys) synthetase
MNTSIAKTKTGWQGNTRVELDDGKVLVVTTAKALDGSLATTAGVHKIVRYTDGSVAESYNRHHYYKIWMFMPVRATEKQVRAQHAEALSMIDEIISEIEQHYAVDRG